MNKKQQVKRIEKMLLGLRREAGRYGITKLSRATGLSRESFYKAFSKKGNPQLRTLAAVTDALGLNIAVWRR